MDASPSLPPYAYMTQEAVQCVAQASLRYDVPELLLHAIVAKERGTMGKCSTNKNGTKDCGLAQINSSWVPFFSKYGINLSHLTNNTCINLYASAYILRDNFNKKGDWFRAIVSYNIGPNRWTDTRYRIGHKYASDVVKYWWGFHGWVAQAHAAQAGPLSFSAPGSPEAKQ